MIIKVLHLLIFNSIKYFLDVLKKHYINIPPLEELQKSEIDMILEKPRTEPPKMPFFNINVVVDENNLGLDPSYDIVEMILTQVFNLHLELVTSFNYFLPDPFYNPFLTPLINGKIEERICGYGPRVSFYINDDKNLASRRKDIFSLLNYNYTDGFFYIERFKYIQNFFAEDYFKTAEEIENERCKF